MHTPGCRFMLLSSLESWMNMLTAGQQGWHSNQRAVVVVPSCIPMFSGVAHKYCNWNLWTLIHHRSGSAGIALVEWKHAQQPSPFWSAEQPFWVDRKRCTTLWRSPKVRFKCLAYHAHEIQVMMVGVQKQVCPWMTRNNEPKAQNW